MKKTLTILVAIGIIGILGVIDKTRPQPAHLVSASNTSAAASVQMGNAGSSMTSGASSSMMSAYKDGTYTGASEQTPYGTVQIAIVVSGSKITDVHFLQMPNDQQSSQERTSYSEPLLKQTTIDKQSANIDFVSGATSTSEGYQQSLQSALNLAVQA